MRTWKLALALIGLAASCAQSQWLEKTIRVPDSLGGISEPHAVYYVPSANCVYVCGEERMMVVDCSTNERLARLDLYEPMLLAYDCRDDKVYLHYEGDDESLAVIDPATHQIVSRVRAGRYIEELCYNPTANKLYCRGGWDTDSVSIIDCTLDSVIARVWVGSGYDEPGAMCCNPAENRVYCASLYDDAVAVIDGSSDSVIRYIPVAGDPERSEYCPVGNKVYCSALNSDYITVIACGPDTVLTQIPVGDRPATLGYDQSSNKLYCAGWQTGNVDIIDCNGDTLLKTLELDLDDPMRFVFDTLDRRVFCMGENADAIPVLCSSGDTVVGYVEFGLNTEYPDMACYSPFQNRIYFVSADYADLMVIDAAAMAVTGIVQISSEPRGVCYASQPDAVYSFDYSSGAIVVIDCASNELLPPVTTPAAFLSKPVYSPRSNKLYCAGGQGNEYVLVAVDCSADTVAAVLPMEGGAAALVCNPAADKVYWANYTDDESSSVVVVDCRTDSAVAKVPVGEYPCSLTCNPDSNLVYCSWREGDTLVIGAICGSGDTITGTVAAWRGGRPSARAMTYISSVNVVCATTEDTAIIVVDGAARQVLGPLYFHDEPYAMLYSTLADRLYCLLPNAADIAVVNCRYMEVEATIRVAADPIGLALDSIANRLYVVNRDAGCVSVIDCSANRFIGLVEAGRNPRGLAWAPSHRRMYIADLYGQAVVVLKDSAVAALADVPSAAPHTVTPTVVRGILRTGNSIQNTGNREELLDATGRRVLILGPGDNDVTSLAPGVYFIHEAQAQAQAQAVRKVIIAR